MSGFIEGEDRHQATLFPERLDDYIAEDSAVRVIDVFVDDLDLSGLGFKTVAEATGRSGYHPATLLKLFIYGYRNRVHSSRRLEREAQLNVELMWLTGRLAPDFKTIADFRKDIGEAIRLVCREFVAQRRYPPMRYRVLLQHGPAVARARDGLMRVRCESALSRRQFRLSRALQPKLFARYRQAEQLDLLHNLAKLAFH